MALGKLILLGKLIHTKNKEGSRKKSLTSLAKAFIIYILN
jgi:hypothetical protein